MIIENRTTQLERYQNIRCLALDLDGTLLNADKQVSERTRQALQAAVSGELTLVIASGRALSTIPREVLQLPGISYAITSNGAVVTRLRDGVCLREYRLEGTVVSRLLPLLEGEPVILEAFLSGEGFIDEEYLLHPERYQAQEREYRYLQASRRPVSRMREFLLQHREELDCLDVIVCDPKRREAILERIRRALPDVYLTSAVPRLLELSNGEGGKHRAFLWLLERLGWKPEQAAAFGDAENDCELLEAVGLGVAMGNAPLSVQKSAAMVTDTNEQDGVAKVIEEILQVQQPHIVPTSGRNNCGGRCLLYAHVRNGRVERMSTDPSSGDEWEAPLRACARGLQVHQTCFREDRLRTPLKRVGKRGEGAFVPISWEQAITELTAEWIRIRDTYGPGSRYVNYAWGVSALMRPAGLAKRLLALDGGFLDDYNSYSTACINAIAPYVYGTLNTGNHYRHYLESKLILLWGHNPQETVFDGLMHFLRLAKQKGIPIIGIDPRKNDTILALDAEWIALKPSTDAALADAMAYVIVTEERYDKRFVQENCMGFLADTLPEGTDPKACYFSYLTGEQDGIEKTPEWGEAITGVSAETIRSLARRLAEAKPAAILQGFGAQRHANGEQSARGPMMLACLTGNVGVPGGSAASTDYRAYSHQKPKLPPVHNPFPGSIPTYLWTDAVERGAQLTEADGLRGVERLDGGIKMMLNLAGNALINQHGDINRTRRMLEREDLCEYIVVSDLFLTASARYADLVLPATSFLEGENMTTPWHNGDFLAFQNQAVEPLSGCRFEYDWLKEVAAGLGLYEAFTEGHETTGEWLFSCYEKLRREELELPEYEELKKMGVYRYQNTPDVIALSRQRENPRQYPYPTPSGRIEIYSPALAARRDPMIPAIPCYVPAEEGPESSLTKRYPLQLIGWHTKKRCHSIHENNPALARLDPQTLRMHPKDAAARGIADGDLVRVWNDRGTMRIFVQLTERVRPGTVALSQGAWYQPDANGVDTAGCINVLTSLVPTPLAHGNGQHTNLVQVAKEEDDKKNQSK